MRRLTLLGLCLMFFSSLFSQDKKFTFDVNDEIVWAGVDRPGDLFIILQSGDVLKYNNTGTIIAQYKSPAPPTVFDAGDGVSSFVYNRKENNIITLSPELAVLTENKIDPSFAINPWLVCPALHELWIFDVSDFSLKKTKLRATAIAFESSVRQMSQQRPEEFISLREYQNYIFLLDRKSGVHVFNGVGKWLRTLGEKGLDYFNFLGEEFYFIKGDELIFIDLYTEEKRNFRLPQSCDRAVVTDNTLYAFKGKSISIYNFKP